jgi:signal transduction histidine kinase
MPDKSQDFQTPAIDTCQKDQGLTEKLEMLERLAATIAHDVRNPLGTVNTSLFAIRTAIERNQPERIEKALSLAERNIKRCDSILAEFLNFTQKIELRIKPVHIESWIKGIIEKLYLPQNIEFIQNLHCDCISNIDPEQLGRAITNVVTNSVEAIKDSSPEVMKITIEAGIEGGSIFICISDTGEGIPDDIFVRVYEPLFSARRFGMGLGLPVAKEIVEKHGGQIDLQTKRGSGTKVTLKIPSL